MRPHLREFVSQERQAGVRNETTKSFPSMFQAPKRTSLSPKLQKVDNFVVGKTPALEPSPHAIASRPRPTSVTNQQLDGAGLGYEPRTIVSYSISGGIGFDPAEILLQAVVYARGDGPACVMPPPRSGAHQDDDDDDDDEEGQ